MSVSKLHHLKYVYITKMIQKSRCIADTWVLLLTCVTDLLVFGHETDYCCYTNCTENESFIFHVIHSMLTGRNHQQKQALWQSLSSSPFPWCQMCGCSRTWQRSNTQWWVAACVRSAHVILVAWLIYSQLCVMLVYGCLCTGKKEWSTNCLKAQLHLLLNSILYSHSVNPSRFTIKPLDIDLVQAMFLCNTRHNSRQEKRTCTNL
jgi:hypothetical protein